MKNGKYYTYAYMINSKIVYFGQGSDAMKSNPYGRGYDILGHNKHCVKNADKIEVEILQHFETKDQVTLEEARQIKRFGLKNLFNLREELTDNKYAIALGLVKGSSIDEMVDANLKASVGAAKSEPEIIAEKLISKIPNKKYDNILVIGNDGFGGLELTNALAKKFKANISFITQKNFDGLSFAINENTKRKGIKFMKQDFLEEEIKEKYDLIVMNPPFTGVGIKMIEKATKICTPKGAVAFIGPSNTLAYGFWRKQKEHFKYVKYLTPEDMKINLNSCLGIWTPEKSDNCVLDIGTIQEPNEVSFNQSKYPRIVPELQTNCTLEEYDEVFDQINGLNFKDSRAVELGTYGIQRNGDDIFWGPLKEQKSSVSIYVVDTGDSENDKKTSEFIIENLHNLVKNKKIIIADKGRTYYTKCFAGISTVRTPSL